MATAEQWADSEFEDSPRSHDGIGGMFSDSPNRGATPNKRRASAYPPQVGGARYQHAYDEEDSAMAAASRALYRSASGDYQPVEMAMVPGMVALSVGQQAKRVLVRRVQQDSMKMLTMTCQAVQVRGPTGRYFVYHLEITSEFYKQKWVVCKRYSEFYRLRKKLLARLAAHRSHSTSSNSSSSNSKSKSGHGRGRACRNCSTMAAQLRAFEFPGRMEMFQDRHALVAKRTNGLEAFIVALCQYMSGGDDATGSSANAATSEFAVCSEITAARFMVKEFLQFPLEHECQHVRAIRQLTYVDPRDVHVDTESCPICLSEWRELDGNQLVLAPCGHFFHEHCINEWYRTRFDCPMCRTIAGLDPQQLQLQLQQQQLQHE